MLIAIGGIFVSPLLLSFICVAFALAISVIAAVAGLVFGSGLAMVILYIVGLSLVVAGFGCMFTYPLTGVGLIGGRLPVRGIRDFVYAAYGISGRKVYSQYLSGNQLYL